MYKLQASEVEPRFSQGCRVRVKIGVMDPDFPDVPLGDWTGTVSQVPSGGCASYLVRWSPETLENVHPACRDYCEKEDITFDKMWLLDGDLEPVCDAPSEPKRRRKVAATSLPC